jgi:HlyD family secretion protein
MKRFWIAALLPVCALLLTSCGQKRMVPSGSGLVEADEVTISAETAGKLLRIYYGEGDTLSRGDTIALIDTTTLTLRMQQTDAAFVSALTRRDNARLQIQQTENDYALADKEYNRISRLVQSGSANQQQLDQTESMHKRTELARQTSKVALAGAEAEIARVEADRALLKKQFDDCRPTAPSYGTVVTKYMDEGELIGVGQAIIQIARIDTVWVKVYLPPADLTKIKLGSKADVDPEDGRATPLGGFVSWISEKAEFTPKNVQTKDARADLVYAVKVKIHNPGGVLKIGMPVSVTIP